VTDRPGDPAAPSRSARSRGLRREQAAGRGHGPGHAKTRRRARKRQDRGQRNPRCREGKHSTTRRPVPTAAGRPRPAISRTDSRHRPGVNHAPGPHRYTRPHPDAGLECSDGPRDGTGQGLVVGGVLTARRQCYTRHVSFFYHGTSTRSRRGPDPFLDPEQVADLDHVHRTEALMGADAP